ncbi:FAD-dependent oxidoreductase [Bythopirellula polymerisocia]|uniref:Coenzyme A disulfide reductase n=1 Tax=Bythopirellula polymerisocia TaxID=2528003 RepID=A0A5C6CXV7_9BACT|nr:FAD-dependent oxidoreductase [Bythopirellula polymerisocia]TWU29803.1 Coenzyme A disulfide reductase [Bythopirellula polymerisocia]
MKIVIVGAVAGGASAAARARRLDEDADIVLIERGEAPSFANCGLPYYVGGVIETRDKLLVTPQQRLIDRYRLDVRTHTEALRIDSQAKTVFLRDLQKGNERSESYDKLILSPGASPLRPPIPGVDLPQVYTLRDLGDADRLSQAASQAEQAVVIGAGFIGLEMTENLVHRGIETTVVELADQVLPPWDAEMVSSVTEHLRSKGVKLELADAAESIVPVENRLLIQLRSGKQLLADLVVLSVGVRPENKLAVEAGLEVGQRGGIKVNDQMQTSDPDIYAVGDVIEVQHFVDGAPVQIPLGGPANRQGRLAADHIFGRSTRFRGTQGTAIVGVFDMTVAMTGLSEKSLRAGGIAFEKIYVHPSHHASYFPGAEQMSIKLLFALQDGKILGAQVVGRHGVDKRIDVFAVAIQAGMTVYDLEEMELAYAPQYGSAKDPVNMAGFVAAGVIKGDQPILHASDLTDGSNRFLLDVRSPKEYSTGHIPGAVNIPVDELRGRLSEIPRDCSVVTYCQVGQRGYLATRVLAQKGYQVANLSGGFTSYLAHAAASKSRDA